MIITRKVKVFHHTCAVCNQPTWMVGLCSTCSDESERFGRLALLEGVGEAIAWALRAKAALDEIRFEKDAER